MKSQAIHHPKIADLAERIGGIIAADSLASSLTFGLCHTLAVGTLERMYHYATTYTPAGDIGKLSPARIADALGFPAQHAQALIEALVGARLLDRDGTNNQTLRIHGWPEHAMDSVHTYLARRRLLFADGTPPKLYLLNGPERSKAQEDYAQIRPPAPAPAFPEHQPRHQIPHQTPAPDTRQATPDPAPDEGDRQHQTPENGTTPHLNHTTPATAAVAPRPPIAHPRRTTGGRSRSSDSNSREAKALPADKEQALAALRKEPWPDITPTKARALAQAHPAEHILAAIKRAERKRSAGRAIGPGLLINWIESGEGAAYAAEEEKRATVERRRGARRWWAQASEVERETARRRCREAIGNQHGGEDITESELYDFIASAFEEAAQRQPATA